jgi:hypothetical protein
MRADFDWTAECGVFVCDSCGYPCYPMEVDYEEDERGCCPECGHLVHVYVEDIPDDNSDAQLV